ncbi:hypothetical protein FB451DRAFT_1371752 [Mycena latifolia]|nr:hypothetical protein FB451DRAFT_1371752 [Mycena latifolia]
MRELAGILDLPTEILVGIFENPAFPTDTLDSLARVCRRLHFIALPLYFSRHAMDSTPNSVVITMDTEGRDLLSVLQSALFIPQTENITCVFPHPSCTSILPLLPHLRRVEAFISRLLFVKHVTLALDTPGSVCLSVGDDQELRAWTSNLEALLNCIIKKQCNSLAVRHGGQFTRAYELCPPIPPRRRISRFLGPVEKLLATQGQARDPYGFRRVPKQGQSRVGMAMPEDVSCAAQLTSLDLESAILLLPPGLDWTLAALRSGRIASLTLHHYLVEPIIWSTVLPLIASAAPNLTTLVLLEAEGMSDIDVLVFLSQLPLIKHLTISTSRTTIIEPHGHPVVELLHLQTLRASRSFIDYFLLMPASLPNIESICILCPIAEMGLDISEFAARLAPITDALDDHGLAPKLSIAVDQRVYSFGSAVQHLSSDLRKCLARVQELEITIMPVIFSNVAEMPGWIARFPCVERVAIRWLDAAPEEVELLVRMTKATGFLNRISVNGTHKIIISKDSFSKKVLDPVFGDACPRLRSCTWHVFTTFCQSYIVHWRKKTLHTTVLLNCGAPSASARPHASQASPSVNLIRLLTSNDVPTSTEVPSILSVLSDHQAQLDLLDAQIKSMQATFAMLYTGHRKTQESILSAVRRVPPELLCEIFSCSSAATRLRGTSVHKLPWRLGHVCALSRHAAIIYPALWRFLHANFSSRPVSDRCPFTHAGSSPLPIRLDVMFEGRSNAFVGPALLDVATLHCNRWATLHLSYPPLIPGFASLAISRGACLRYRH